MLWDLQKRCPTHCSRRASRQRQPPKLFFFLNVFCVTILVFITFYTYNYEMMMMGMKEWGRAVVGERDSVNPWQYLHRFSSYPCLYQVQAFCFLLGSLGQPLQLVKVWYGRPARFSTVQESYRSA